MKILFFGDIFGRPGREALAKIIPELKEQYNPDLILANGENMAHGKGVTPHTLQQCIDAGVEFFTSGNHIFAKKEVIELLEDAEYKVLRPANFPPSVPGRGYKVIQLRTYQILLISVMGRAFMKEELADPFATVDELIALHGKDANTIIVDFHAETTSEKKAMGFHLDGRVSAVFGTHTHVPTQDFHITENGTAYVTDIGMVGPTPSVLGVEKDVILKRFYTQMPAAMKVADTGKVEVNAMLFDVGRDGKALGLEKIYQQVEL